MAKAHHETSHPHATAAAAPAADSPELVKLAQELYARAVLAEPNLTRQAEHIAAEAFTRAEVFLAVAAARHAPVETP